MVVSDKIEEAEFFLKQMSVVYPNSEMQHYVSAFMSATKSIGDYLLEDYNQKFVLNIPLDEKLTIERFKKEANRQNNLMAQKFIAYYEQEFDKIKKDPLASMFINKRNVNIHRKTTDKPMHANVNIQVGITESVEVVARDKDGNIIGRRSTAPQEPPRSESKVEVKWFFSEYMSDEVPVVCEKFLSLMKTFASKMLQTFP